jgi:hypothetical protein
MPCWAAKPNMKSSTTVLPNEKLEAISRIGFWFKIAAGTRFTPEAYVCMSKI